MQTNYYIFESSSISKSLILGDKTKPFLKGNLHKYGEKKASTVFDKLDISNEEDFCHQLFLFFTVIWTQTAGFVTALNPLSSLLRISCRFQFRNLWRAWNGQHWLFHNLALFSIYGNDGTTVSKKDVIINLKKYHWEKILKKSSWVLISSLVWINNKSPVNGGY